MLIYKPQKLSGISHETTDQELKNQKLTSNWTAEGDKDTKSKQTKETSQEEIAYLPEMYDFRAKP